MNSGLAENKLRIYKESALAIELEYGKEAVNEWRREIFKRDLWLLSFLVLEQDNERRLNLMDDYVVRMCEFAQEDVDNTLVCATRNAFKSELCNINRNIQRYLQNPNGSYGICSATFLDSVKFNYSIRKKVQLPELISLYPNLFNENKNRYDLFTRRDILLSGRVIPDKTPTFKFFSVVDGSTGDHFDTITIDDPVNDKNSSTSEQINKVNDGIGNLEPLLKGKGDGSDVRTFIGTTYEFSDAISTMLRDKQNYRQFYQPYFELDENGNLTDIPISRRGSKEFIEKMRNNPLIGDRIVSAQYLLNPLNINNMGFDVNAVLYFSDLPEDRQYNIYISLDPAISEKSQSCLNAISCVAVDQYGEFWIDKIIAERITNIYRPSSVIKQIIELHKYYSMKFNKSNVNAVVESVAYQKAIISNMEDEMIQQNYHFRPIPCNPENDKTLRIFNNLEPLITKGMFHVRPEMKELVEDIRYFPRCMYKDRLDSISQVRLVCNRAFKEHIYVPKNIPTHSLAGIDNRIGQHWRNRYIKKQESFQYN